MSGPATKDTLLDAGEALFAEHGYAATSLRQLTERAGVHLAAVNYHFGSKAELAKAVLSRRIAPINAERLRRLDALPRRATVEAIVRAFVEPPLRGGQRLAHGPAAPAPAHRLCRVFGRISVEQPLFLRAFLDQQFRKVGERFASALAIALPDQEATTLWWRLHFVVGAMAHIVEDSCSGVQAGIDGRPATGLHL